MKKKGGVTIHDISKALGIDSSTVSRALNNSPKVMKATKQRILDKAAELGYQKNILASNLRTRKTNTIGVVIPRISRYFFASIIAGVEEAAYKKSYSVVIAQSLDNFEREDRLIKTLYSNRVDGILISVSMETTESPYINQLIQSNYPIIFVDRPYQLGRNTNVVIDDFKTSYNAVEHLIKNGCKNIVHFAGPQKSQLYKERANGYKAALKNHGIAIREDYIYVSKLMREDGIDCAKKILDMPMIDGVFCANDTSAISAMQYLKKQGIKIPEDIAFVGFSNEPVSAVMVPSLTTTNQPGFDMGAMAANLLIEKIENPELIKEDNTIVLNAKLLPRESSVGH